METIEFWGTFLGLLSNLIVAIISLGKKEYVKLLKYSTIILSALIITFVVISQKYQEHKIIEIQKEIISFIKNANIGYQSKTLSEITDYLRIRKFDETKYSNAITDLLKDKVLIENHIILYSNNNASQPYNCLLYSLNYN